MPKNKICCAVWEKMIRTIKVSAYDKNDNKSAMVLEELLKYQFGNFCPTCGNKLMDNHKKLLKELEKDDPDFGIQEFH